MNKEKKKNIAKQIMDNTTQITLYYTSYKLV